MYLKKKNETRENAGSELKRHYSSNKRVPFPGCLASWFSRATVSDGTLENLAGSSCSLSNPKQSPGGGGVGDQPRASENRVPPRTPYFETTPCLRLHHAHLGVSNHLFVSSKPHCAPPIPGRGPSHLSPRLFSTQRPRTAETRMHCKLLCY